NTLTRHRVSSLPVEPWSIAVREGAKIQFGHLLTHGSLFYEHEGYVIAINKTLSDSRKQFTIAHELGHLFIHQLRMGSLRREASLLHHLEAMLKAEIDEERFCDAFAAYLLVPESSILKYRNWRAISISSLTRMSSQLRVSVKTLVRRVLDAAP